jgi:hypothetical protein
MDQRRFKWKSGRLSGAPLQGFWQPPSTLDAADPQIPWLPLLSPSGGAGTTVSVPVASHSYTAQVPQVRVRVQPGAVTHSYTSNAPKFVGSIPVGVVTHSYTLAAPKVSTSVQAGTVTHTYSFAAPKLSLSLRPSAVSHTYTGQAPGFPAPSGVLVPVVSHTYSPLVPQVKASVFAGPVTHAYSMLGPKVSASVRPGTASHSYAAATPQLSTAVSSPTATHVYSGAAPAVLASTVIQVPLVTHTYQPRVPTVEGAAVPAAPGGDGYLRRRKRKRPDYRNLLQEAIERTLEELVLGEPEEVAERIFTSPEAFLLPARRPPAVPLELLSELRAETEALMGEILELAREKRARELIEEDDREVLALAWQWYAESLRSRVPAAHNRRSVLH